MSSDAQRERPHHERSVHVAPERLDGWLTRFAQRHGDATWSTDQPHAAAITLRAADGCIADCIVPFSPLHVDERAPYGGLVEHATRERTVGVALVRLGGYAVGVFTGATVQISKVGSRPVHGRAAAGGWSQHRFARRRENQAGAVLDDPRLAPLQALLTPRLLDVPTPNRRILDGSPARFRAVPIRVRELPGAHGDNQPDSQP
jgi:Actinobacteria/chloroflexi VLRF1 release factor